jgi:hypothetical protein
VSVPIRRASGRKSAPVRAVEVVDFSGGLNTDAGQFNLAKNELPEIEDMDIIGRGGVRRRRAVKLLKLDGETDGFDLCPRSVFGFEATSSNRYVYVVAPKDVSGVNKLLWYSVNGSDLQPFTSDFGLVDNAAVAGMTAPLRSVVADGSVYGVWGFDGAVTDRPRPIKITDANSLLVAHNAGPLYEAGCQASGSNFGWTETILTPEPGSLEGIVNGKTIAYHYGYLFVGNTIEGNPTAVRHPSRVRWSHPDDPERWREDDWIDIEIGKDADQITAMVPYRDHLLVFKNRSVHAIYGDSPDTFTVVNLSGEFGCVSQEAVVTSPFGVFFFDRLSGLWQWTGSEFRWLFGPLGNLLREQQIPADKRANVHVGWVNNRVWVGVPWVGQSALARARTFIYDPSIGRSGAWTKYSKGFGPFAAVRQVDDSLLWVSGCSGTALLQKLEQSGDSDEFTLDGSGVPEATPIRGSFRTPWFDQVPGAVKQWKRPDIVASSPNELNLIVEAFHDYEYEAGNARKTFFVTQEPDGVSLVWEDDLNVATSGQWDVGSWVNEKDRILLARGSNVGRSKAMALRFSTPAGLEVARWSIDGLTVKFREKRVRG